MAARPSQSLIFRAPRRVEVEQRDIAVPGPGQVGVRVTHSAISAGTEMLVYRGELPDAATLDASIPSLGGKAIYPFAYGYCCVGVVDALGDGVPSHYEGQRVFLFHPHASYVTLPARAIIPLPVDVSDKDALFLPNMETAVSLVQDGRPILGEHVAVLGLGIVGLLLSDVLRPFPLERLILADPLPQRRARVPDSRPLVKLVDPSAQHNGLRASLGFDQEEAGADLVFEVSGNPAALNDALAVTGFGGRIIVGSWYGKKSASIDLGGRFHRSNITIQSSQVSRLHPRLTGRWNKERRWGIALDMVRNVKPSAYITHQFSIEQAAEAYALLDADSASAGQVIFTYSHG